jgi:tetratricopeptide (TPR) repeat protein
MTRAVRWLRVTSLALAVFGTTPAWAQDADGVTRDAAKHFQRAVALYGEADYRAALVEFKRAYALVPNAAVLYNVGETEYQLQDYAGALTTFKRYLSEASPTEAHRSEVEGNVEVLRSRVGHLTIQTVPSGADVSIDDQPIGKTPLAEAALVSIGHRKVLATTAGRPPVSRYVDVAAEDNVTVTLTLPPPAETLASTATGPAQTASPSVRAASHDGLGPTLRALGWIATGAFAAGAVTFGILATKESNDLKSARATFPTTAATLNHDASLTTAYAVVTDALGAAAIVVGGITLYSTLSASNANTPKRGAGDIRVMLGPSSARLEGRF